MNSKVSIAVRLIMALVFVAITSLSLSSCMKDDSPTSAVPTKSFAGENSLQKLLNLDRINVIGYVYYPKPLYNRFHQITGYDTIPWPGQSGDTVYLALNDSTFGLIGLAPIQSNGSYSVVTARTDTSLSLRVSTTLYEHNGSRLYIGQTTFYHTEVLPGHDSSNVNIKTTYAGEY